MFTDRGEALGRLHAPMICKARSVTKYVTLLPYNPSRHSYDTTIITPSSLPSRLQDWSQTEISPIPWLARIVFKIDIHHQERQVESNGSSNYPKHSKHVLILIGSFDRNTVGDSMYMHQFTNKRPSLYFPNKRPWKQLWNNFMNIHIDCLSRLVSCKLICWAGSAPQEHKQVKY